MNKIVGVYCEITSRCNQHCPYCYNEKYSKEFSELTIDDIKKIAKELDLLHISGVTLSGGEPFLHSDLYNVLEVL